MNTRYTHCPLSLYPSVRLRRYLLSQTFERTLDRVAVLGDASIGHTGCVNALSWANNGELLISGGDDTTIRIWAIDAADTSREYPYTCRSVIHTGHRANIFSTQMLPYSSRIVTVAGDQEVRVFDLGNISAAPNGHESSYNADQLCTHVLRCHQDRVKRIVTEYSPDLFLTASEDGTVRQHDLRASHDCYRSLCPTPLVKIDHELSTLALSPLTPYHFVVAGDSSHGYLFDRRHVGRELREEWGVPETTPNGLSLTTCIRRFGRPIKTNSERGERIRIRDHITGARMSTHNGHEVLLNFSGDAVYLYSTYDHPESEKVSTLSSQSSMLGPSPKRKRTEELAATKLASGLSNSGLGRSEDYASFAAGIDNMSDDDSMGEDDIDHDDDSDEEEDYPKLTNTSELYEDSCSRIPMVLPQQRYAGARNVETVKDVNFLGPTNELVASGSDDGNFFIWRKATGVLHAIYEGDGSVVNMVEGHPHLPLVAVSGIDHTVKLFAPSNVLSEFSRTSNATSIIKTNAHLSRTRSMRYNFTALLAERANTECRNQ